MAIDMEQFSTWWPPVLVLLFFKNKFFSVRNGAKKMLRPEDRKRRFLQLEQRPPFLCISKACYIVCPNERVV